MIDKNVEALTRIADRHYLIERGRVVWTGTSAELAAAPEVQHQYLGILVSFLRRRGLIMSIQRNGAALSDQGFLELGDLRLEYRMAGRGRMRRRR